MNKTDRLSLIKWAKSLSNKQLEAEYYTSVCDCLGSKTEEMYGQGYDIRDIVEQEKYEEYLCKKSDILENICIQRGIKLWEEPYTNHEKLRN